MSRLAIVALLVALPLAAANEPRQLTVQSRSSIQLQVAGATAAWAIDPQIADVAVSSGVTTIFGRSAGKTSIVIVAMTGQQMYAVTVTPRASALAATVHDTSTTGSVGAAYTSASRELQTSLHLRGASGERKTELAVENLTSIRRNDDRDRVSTPSASYTITTPRRSLTLLDQNAALSALTLDRTGLRGIHYEDDRWSLHGGVTSYAAFRSFLVPAEREYVASVSRRLALFGGTVTPTILATHARDRRGLRTLFSVASRWRRGTVFDADAEVAYGGRFAGAGSMSYRRNGQQLAADALYRPRGTTSVGPASNHGTFVNAAWAIQRGVLEATVRGSLNRYDELYSRQSIDTISADVRYRLGHAVTLITGGNGGRFTGTDVANSYSLPVGLELQGARSSLLVLPRYSFNSSTNEGGLGFRAAARTSHGRFSSNAYVDVQQFAPTLEVIYREQPELRTVLAELGINATTPADIARALRENATLANLGFVENVTVELAPRRSLAGWEATWRGAGDARRHLRLRTFLSRVEGVSRDTQTVGAALTWSQRITSDLDVYAGVSNLRISRSGETGEYIPSVQLGFRKSFDDGISFDVRSGSIAGTVFLDDEITGDLTRGMPLAGAEVSLDGQATVVTKGDGRYVFPGIRNAPHRVTVRVPAMPDAYFTTPSSVTATRGETVNFGVSRAPARLFGRVTSDAGNGVSAVRLTLRTGGQEFRTTTDSSGTYAFAVPPGSWQLELHVDSLPPGFVLESEGTMTVTLDRATPSEVNHRVRANRSISGRVLQASLPATIRVEPTGRVITTGADGSYSVRGLPAGAVKLTVTAGGSTFERVIELSADPATVRAVDFGSSLPASSPATIASTDRTVTAEGRIVVVQIGAFRVAQNADAAVARAKAAGVEPVVARMGQLTTVRVGPFASASDAHGTLTRLHRAGIEAMLVRVR